MFTSITISYRFILSPWKGKTNLFDCIINTLSPKSKQKIAAVCVTVPYHLRVNVHQLLGGIGMGDGMACH